jgi:hypothetical protein
MKTATFAGTSIWSVSARRLIGAVALGGAVIGASLAGATTAWAQPAGGSHHSGPDYSSITGWRVGAPSEEEVSFYGGSHKHEWVEQQLYGPGVVDVPRVDTTVHQSR